VSAVAVREVAFVSRPIERWRVVRATTGATIKRNSAYLINVIRQPLLPLVMYLTMSVAYSAAGRDTAGGANVQAFLLVGIIGLLSWQVSIWSSGHSLEEERWEGTIASLFLTPASRAGVIAGYGLGGLVMALPSVLVVGILALVTGAEFNVGSLAAAALGALALGMASVATGFAMASLFLLSRRGNLMANVIQQPAMLLCGFFVPRDELPSWLMPLSNAIPVSHALDAFRAAMLDGATVRDLAEPAGLALLVSLVYVGIGTFGLRRLEYAAKRSGQLELF
jgi:ABC-2 type transport system permease protein